MPDKEKANVGFTCTGLYWDKEEESFFIGNAGKYKPNDKTFQASIEIVEKDFSAIKGDIPCYLKFENMRDIQGVTKSTDGTILVRFLWRKQSSPYRQKKEMIMEILI